MVFYLNTKERKIRVHIRDIQAPPNRSCMRCFPPAWCRAIWGHKVQKLRNSDTQAPTKLDQIDVFSSRTGFCRNPRGFFPNKFWKKGKDPHPQDKSQYLDFAKDPRPLYYKTTSCVFYHKNLHSKAVFGP